MSSSADRAVAIVGVGAVLPDAPNAPTFWQNIRNKRYSISETPPERWSIADYYNADPSVPDKTYSKIGGWVRDFQFDWKRFRVPPKVAAAMDESQQWAVTIAAEALADFGYPQRPLDTDRTGIILGTAMGGEMQYVTTARVNWPEYVHWLNESPEFAALSSAQRAEIVAQMHARMDRALPQITEDTMPGELPNIVAGRVANVLNLRGPNFITDAACASSFAAVQAACEALNAGQADAVIAGGVDRNMGASSFVKFCKIGALSASGSRPFGAGADGFVMGEGSGAFLLKRLADAERDGDKIYAVIRGVAGSSDGKGKGITAPNPQGQLLAIQRAWENAGLEPSSATLVEAHGTSTRVGDVVEVESLSKMFGPGARPGSIALGSAKSNIGHLKAGAGAAGLLKAAMSIYDKVLPPTLNAQQPNPNIDFAQTPFYLNHELKQWDAPQGAPRRAGVSAYGFGGTNFHLVMEEYVPGMLKSEPKSYASADVNGGNGAHSGSSTAGSSVAGSGQPPQATRPLPPRGILAVGAASPAALKDQLDDLYRRVESGWTPARALPAPETIRAAERLVIDFSDQKELLDKLSKARKAAGFDNPQAWKALQGQGIFRGSGPRPGKIAFLFPGQGSQYANMGRELAALSPSVASVFAEADRVMTPILGRTLTSYIFVDSADPAAVKQVEKDLMQTAITQPAMLTLDTAMLLLLRDYGFTPDMAMGHSLGEYAALIAAGIMPFAQALEASAARGAEMTKVALGDNGWMAAVMAPYSVIEDVLKQVDGYVVAANINSNNQSVVGGEAKAVQAAMDIFAQKGFTAVRIPVSHAFHTKLVAPASAPLRKVLNRFDIRPPQLPLVANVTGDLYPNTVEGIKDILELQIASPVQWVKGLETLYANGVRTFVEVGPKKALKGFVDDVLVDKTDVWSLFSNHPKTGELASFNHALCGLYAAGYGLPEQNSAPVQLTSVSLSGNGAVTPAAAAQPAPVAVAVTAPVTAPVSAQPALPADMNTAALGQALAQLLQQFAAPQAGHASGPAVADRNETPAGSVIVTGTGLGLPGAKKSVMDPDNALRILRGEQFVDLIPERFRKEMASRHITRLVKSADGSGSFETISDTDDVIKLAGRGGAFDLSSEYGVPAKLVEALDITTQLAMAAGLDALREANIPLVQTYRATTKGTFLPERWMLPESLRDETGVVFASAFPGGDRMADEFRRFYVWNNLREQMDTLEELRRYTSDAGTLGEIERRLAVLRDEFERNPYEFDRRFIFRILAMGHSQFAEYIGARGPNTHVNAACASTAQAMAVAEDWIRTGRCRRVIVVSADDVTSDNLMGWIGSGFLSTGAAAIDDRVEEAALPFDRRRHGTLLGMGACALVVESQDVAAERGMRGIVEVLSTETANSAYHGTRIDVDHVSDVMNRLVTSAERRFGLNRYTLAQQLVFISHETFTPARGGSAAAEVTALRKTFGDATPSIVVCNTKGFTGHPMGAGVEDVIAVKILEYGIVPPVANYKEVDPELGTLNLSRGGRYPVQYALHLAAGFGSQISMTLVRRIPGALERVDNKPLYQQWLADVSGYDMAETEVVKRVLRVVAQGSPKRVPAANRWQYGTGPAQRTPVSSNGLAAVNAPLPMVMPQAAASAAASTAMPQAAPSAPAYVPPPAAPQPQPVPPPAARPAPAPAPVAVVAPAPQPVAPVVAAAPAAAPSQPVAVDLVEAKVLAVVAAKTGYPQDMLDPSLDLEADLGIDTVKQAETFAAVREAFDIPQLEGIKLRDYPTLGAVVEFVYAARPELRAQRGEESGASGVGTAPAPAPVTNDQLPVTNNQPASQPVAGDPVEAKVLAVVAEKTGYPQDMLDPTLDLEADLGIDTVKQAETFAAVREAFNIPQLEGIKLRDYPTLGAVVEFVYAARPELRAQQGVGRGASGVGTAPAAAPVANDQLPVTNYQSTNYQSTSQPVASDIVADKVMSVVADKTGYPQEMLDPDLDLEADLGIDTVKQAETFAAVREAFAIPQLEGIKLRDYPTLQSVIDFVYAQRPELRAQQGVGSRVSGVETPSQPVNQSTNQPMAQAPSQPLPPTPPSAPAAAPAPAAPPAADVVAAKVLQVVADKTGYPTEMLDFDSDLEADLGIDTVKQAETFAAVRSAFDIPTVEGLKLRDYPTLQSVIDFVYTHRPELRAQQGVGSGVSGVGTATTPVAQPASQPAGLDTVSATVLSLVADKTGYPTEMLDLDSDLEADLGVDTVKQAETFAAVRAAFNIPTIEGLKLRDYPTLQSVIEFVYTHRPELRAQQAVGSGVSGVETAAAAAPVTNDQLPITNQPVVKTIGTLEDADRMPRRVPVPSLRPALDLCLPTGIALDEGSRVVVMMDQGGVGKTLTSRLQKQGVTVLALEPGVATATMIELLQQWLADGPIQGVYWLAALDAEPALEEMEIATWREMNRVRVKNLFSAMRTVYESVAGPGRFLVSATRLGGLHGYGATGATAPMGGAVTGFTKAYNIEQGLRDEGKGLIVKAVDFDMARKSEPADLLIAETLSDPGVVEVGYYDGLRYTITLEEQPAADGKPGMVLDEQTVFVVTGAAGGITSAIVSDLAVNSRGIFYLLDLVQAPARDDAHVALFRNDKDALKRTLIDEAKARGEKPTPATVDKQIAGIERSEAALRAIESVEATGGTAHYFSLDLRDADAVQAVVDDVRNHYGKIDVLLHAGGMLIDRTLPNKEPSQFDLVFDIKADGFFSLLKAARGMPIGATVSFSSVAGRFGNNGQSDYSSANDLLCKISSSMRQWRPETRGIAIDWTAWGSIGMASRGSVPAIMEALGVDMLPPESGVPTIRRELTYGGTRGEILVAGRLGLWTAEKAPNGGLDADKVNAMLAARQSPLVMAGKVTAARLFGGLEVETMLDPAQQPFLFDHMVDEGVPWLPGVMGTEALAEVASLLAPGASVAAVEKLEILSAFKFHRNKPQTLYLSATARPAADGTLVADVWLRSQFQPPKAELPPTVKDHFHARVVLQQNALKGTKIKFKAPKADLLAITKERIYQVFFHGPAYQVIERANVEGDMVTALMAHDLGPNTSPADAASLMAPRLVELCFQAAALWSIEKKGAMALPSGAAVITAFRQPEEANGKRLYALVKAVDEGAAYDAQVVDESGNVYVDVKGYRTVQMPGEMKLP